MYNKKRIFFLLNLIFLSFIVFGSIYSGPLHAQTITPPIAASQALALKTGLNFISFTIEPNITPEQLQTQNPAIKEIYYFEAAAGSFLTLSRGELKTLSAGRGYIIESSADLLINLSGQQLGVLGNIDLKAGFNLVGFSKMPEQVKFSELMNRYSEIKGLYKFNTMAGAFVSAVRNDSGEVMLLDGADPEFKAGEAVFVSMARNTTINYDYSELIIGDGSSIITEVKVVSSEITPAGGIIKVDKPGCPLNGFEINVPPGAFEQNDKINVSYSSSSNVVTTSGAKVASPIIKIECNTTYTNEPVAMSIPVKINSDEFAMAFYYDEETGKFEGIPSEERTNDKIVIITRRLNDETYDRLNISSANSKSPENKPDIKIIIEKIPKDSLIKYNAYDTHYTLGKNNWRFSNWGSYLSSKGICAGMSISSLWYYIQNRNDELFNDKRLYGDIYDPLLSPNGIDISQLDDVRGYKFASVIQYDFEQNDKKKEYIAQQQKLSHEETMWQFLFSMMITQEPQFLAVRGIDPETTKEVGHALVVYKIANSQLYIADPNYPNEIRTIKYSNNSFEPFPLGLNALSKDSIVFNKISYYGVRSLIDWNSISKRWDETIANPETIGNIEFVQNILQYYNYEFNEFKNFEQDLITNSSQITLRAKNPKDYLGLHLIRFIFEKVGENYSIVNYDNITNPQCTINLKPGKNIFGLAIYSLVGPDGNTLFGKEATWLDFKWITINYIPPPSTLSITPSSTTVPLNGSFDLSTIKVTTLTAAGEVVETIPKERLKWEKIMIENGVQKLTPLTSLAVNAPATHGASFDFKVTCIDVKDQNGNLLTANFKLTASYPLTSLSITAPQTEISLGKNQNYDLSQISSTAKAYYLPKSANAIAKNITPVWEILSGGGTVKGNIYTAPDYSSFVILRATYTEGKVTVCTTLNLKVIIDAPLTGLIAFTSSIDGGQEIFTMKPDGSDLERVTYNKRRKTKLAWSPDGNKIAYYSEGTSNSAVCFYDLNTKQETEAYKGFSTSGSAIREYFASATFSFDNALLYIHTYKYISNNLTNLLYSYNLTNNSLTLLNSNSDVYGIIPVPNEPKFLYSTSRKLGDIIGFTGKIIISNIDGSNKLIFNDFTMMSNPRISPDHTKILSWSPEYSWYMISVTNSDLNSSRHIGGDLWSPERACSLCWSPDGNKILGRIGANLKLCIMNIDFSNIVYVSTGVSIDPDSPTWWGPPIPSKINNFKISMPKYQQISSNAGQYVYKFTLKDSVNLLYENESYKYTVDGSDPKKNGIKYTGPITISGNTTVKFYVSKPGFEDSETNMFTISGY